MAKRKVIKRVTTPNYVVEDFKNPPKKEVKDYRTVKKGDHLIKVAILKEEGPRGGRTKATSLWHPESEYKRDHSRKSKRK